MYLQKLFNLFKGRTYASTVNEPIRMGYSFGKKAVFAGAVPQSGGEFIHQWDTVIKTVKEKKYDITTCLMLGVAGGTAINSLRKYYPGIHITGIELDPVILDISLRHGLFKVGKKTIIKIADAIEWIQTDKNTYDLILVDLYIGDLNPEAVRQDAFLKDVKTHLTPKGIVLFNCHYRNGKKGEYKEFSQRLGKFYSEITVIFEFPKNKVLLLKSNGNK